MVDADKNDFKLTSNLFFERGFYPRFERMMDELGKMLGVLIKAGCCLKRIKILSKNEGEGRECSYS